MSDERVAPGELRDWIRHQFTLQSREAWETFESWIDETNPSLLFSTASSLSHARELEPSDLEQAQAQAQAQADRGMACSRMRELLSDGTVLVMPTTPGPAPVVGQKTDGYMGRLIALTTVASTAGFPQVQVPVAHIDDVPIGLSFVGRVNSDEQLLKLACELEAALASDGA